MTHPTARLLLGDVRERLRELPAGSVHCCATSSPYWNLRQYNTTPQLWGVTDPACPHEWGPEEPGQRQRWGDVETLSEKQASNRGSRANVEALERSAGCFCQRCGCWKGELGSEPTPEQFVRNLVEVFREVKRVLRDDGTLWLNLGDSYASGGCEGTDVIAGPGLREARARGRKTPPAGLKPGDLCAIPWRAALALQADGWLLRSAVVWHKGNPIPESVSGPRWERCRRKVAGAKRGGEPGRVGMNPERPRPQADHDPENAREFASAQYGPCPGCPKCEQNDGLILRWGAWRPTKSYEMVFLLVKTGRYYCDQESVRQPYAESTLPQVAAEYNGNGLKLYEEAEVQNPSDVKRRIIAGLERNGGSNMRDVWKLNSEPYPEAHFATFPTALPTLCIRAGSPERCCAACGAGWARMIERKTFDRSRDRIYAEGSAVKAGNPAGTVPGSNTRGMPDLEIRVLGSRPTCSCKAPAAAAVVLDPFAGSGTTGEAALRLGRDFWGIELNPDYLRLAEERLRRCQAQPTLDLEMSG